VPAGNALDFRATEVKLLLLDAFEVVVDGGLVVIKGLEAAGLVVVVVVVVMFP
jgi:hypothetical protein